MCNLIQVPPVGTEPTRPREWKGPVSPCNIKCNNECEGTLKSTKLCTDVNSFDVLISLYPYVFIGTQLFTPA